MSASEVSPELQRWVAAQRTADGSLPVPVPVPEPMPVGDELVLPAGDREVRVLASTRNPRVVVLGELLSPDECDELVSLARGRLDRSTIVTPDTGTGAVIERRTSEGMFFARGENALCARIESRIAALLRWPLENGEDIQVLRYGPGGEFAPHHDYFDPGQPGTRSHVERGGQRVATLIMYLADPARGGATTFPETGLEVAPVKGNAVFFSYDRPHPITRTLHAGAPVLEGEKWAATKWLRQSAC